MTECGPHNPSDNPTMDSQQNNDADAALADCLRLPIEEQASALNTICAEHPTHEESLRNRFALLRQFGLSDLCEESSEVGEAPSPRRFGDFELLEVLGVGGMGIVHRARQIRLNREVVIKLIRPEQLHFESSRERFAREAEAVAQLQHPGIVPIHLVGEHEGVPFFVMESIHGVNLEEVLESLVGHAPESLSGQHLTRDLKGTWPVACAGIAQQVAEALEHAHSKGVLHRDVKPSNILLSSDGRAHLVDFGLHAIAGQETGQRKLTRHGSTPGTLLYMPPEQLESGIYDERSEVYALAATLYELLTLQPPFHGKTRTQTEERIRKGNADPILPRNRSVPTDLEAVVLRALRPEPGRRYASMKAFGADLANACAGRPVTAKPSNSLYRLRRWATRQPALAFACVAILLLVTILPTAFVLQQLQHNKALVSALEDEKQALAESENLAGVLLELFDNADPAQGKPSPAVTSILDKSVKKIEERLADSPLREALLKSTLGKVHGNLGLWEEGLVLLQDAIDGFDRYLGDHPSIAGPDEQQILINLAEAHTRYALLVSTRGRPGQAMAMPHRQEAIDLLADVWGDTHWRTIVARAEFLRLAGSIPEGTVEGHVPPSSDAVLEALRHAVTTIDGVAEVKPQYRAGLLGQLGSQLLRTSLDNPAEGTQAALAEAEEVIHQCREVLDACGAKDTLDWANATNSLALVYKQKGKLAAAAPLYEELALIYAERLGENSVEHGTILVNHSQLLFQRSQPEEAIQLLEKARGIFVLSLGGDHPTLVSTEGNLLGTLAKLSRFDGLAVRYDSLIPRQEKVFGKDHPVLAMSYFARGAARASDGEIPEAKQDMTRSLEILNALGQGDGPFATTVQTKLDSLP